MVSHRTLVTSLYDVFVTSQALLWHHRISLYKTPRAWPIGDLPHLGLRVHLTLVQGSTAGYSCMLGLTRWCVPVSGAYFLQLYLIGLLLLWASSPNVDAPKHADTSRECNLEYFVRRPHRTDLLSVGAREHYSGCTSLHLRKCITTGAPHHPPTWHTSHIYIYSSILLLFLRLIMKGYMKLTCGACLLKNCM